MGQIRKALWAVGIAALGISALVLTVKYAVLTKQPVEKVEITSRTVLERITNQYFVVTKSAFIDQESELNIDKGSAWSNFLWGQTVTARGIVRVDIGTDLSRLTENDISVDNRAKTVTIDVPAAEIMDASQYGDITVKSKQGVLKYLLDNDPNEDHNRALAQLVADAKVAVRQDTRLFEEARNDTTKLLNLIITGMGYRLVLTEPASEPPSEKSL